MGFPDPSRAEGQKINIRGREFFNSLTINIPVSQPSQPGQPGEPNEPSTWGPLLTNVCAMNKRPASICLWENTFVIGENTSVYGDDILGRSRASALRNFLPRCLHHPSPDTPKSIRGGSISQIILNGKESKNVSTEELFQKFL